MGLKRRGPNGRGDPIWGNASIEGEMNQKWAFLPQKGGPKGVKEELRPQKTPKEPQKTPKEPQKTLKVNGVEVEVP